MPKNERARSVLNRSVAHVITELQDDNKLPASCQLGRIYVVKDCMKVGNLRSTTTAWIAAAGGRLERMGSVLHALPCNPSLLLPSGAGGGA